MSRRKAVPQRRSRTAKPKVQPRHLNRPPMDLERKGFLTVRTAAQFLDKSEWALRGFIKRGEFPPHVYGRRLGRQITFDKVALTKWMKEGREGSLKAS